MKIGITCYPTFGGSGVLATELGKALAQKGHQIHFISYAMPQRLNHFEHNIFFHEVEFTNYPLLEFPLYTLALTSKMLEVYKYEKLDILHVHYAIPHAVSAYLAKQILKKTNDNIRIVTTLHGTDITLVGLEPSFMPLVKFSIEESCAVTAVSRFLKEKTITNYNIEKDIEVIYNFVDTNIYKRSSRNCCFKERFAPNNEKILIHTSNFRPVKRVTDVIKTFHSVQKEIPSVLLMVGDGPDRSEAERLARDLEINNKIYFLGKQDALADLLNISDLFLLPSQSESFGLAALEAMACGIPVVCTSVGGLPEVVRHNETGFIAEIGDTERMAKYCIELFKNEKKYNLFSENSIELVNRSFNIDKIIPQYENLYSRILDACPE